LSEACRVLVGYLSGIVLKSIHWEHQLPYRDSLAHPEAIAEFILKCLPKNFSSDASIYLLSILFM